MYKLMKPGRRYFLINLNEPYAEKVYEVLKKGQEEKGEWPEGDMSFEEWIEFSFSKEEIEREGKKFLDNLVEAFK